MGAATMHAVSVEGPLREQLSDMWSNWMHWAVSNPDKRRALALLEVSDDITGETRAAAHQAMAGAAEMMERACAGGPMRDAPMRFAVALMNALAEATMDFVVNDPANAEQHSTVGFDALSRMLGT